jgi:hypothetical protein
VLHAGRLPVGEPWRQEFRIEPGPDTPELVLGEPMAECEYPATTTLRRSPDGIFLLTLEVRPEQAAGDLYCRIRVPVATPEKWRPLQVAVSAKVGMEFRAIPERMFLAATDRQGGERTFHLRLLGPAGTDLNPDAVSWDGAPPGVSFRLGKAAENTVPVTMAFGEELDGALRAQNPIRIAFRHPGAEPATLILIHP